VTNGYSVADFAFRTYVTPSSATPPPTGAVEAVPGGSGTPVSLLLAGFAGMLAAVALVAVRHASRR
jgi:hypothetical protein